MLAVSLLDVLVANGCHRIAEHDATQVSGPVRLFTLVSDIDIDYFLLLDQVN